MNAPFEEPRPALLVLADGEIVRERGLAQLSDEGELGAIADRVLGENPKAVADYRAGKLEAIGPLVGKVIAATERRANAQVARRLLEERLNR